MTNAGFTFLRSPASKPCVANAVMRLSDRLAFLTAAPVDRAPDKYLKYFLLRQLKATSIYVPYRAETVNRVTHLRRLIHQRLPLVFFKVSGC
jgi:hypothetical protein